MDSIFKKDENLTYLTILILIILNTIYKGDFEFFLIFWIIVILILGNVRRLNSNSKSIYFIRMAMYFLPYSIPIILFHKNIKIYRDMLSFLLGILLAFLISVLVYIIERKKYKVYLSDFNIANCIRKPKYKYVLQCFTLIGSAICEELFFRNYILTINSHINLLLFISVFYFFSSHFMLKWNDQFRKYDFLKQIMIGFISAILFLLSESIIPSIILHIIMNSFNVIYEIKCYRRHYKFKEFYDNLNGMDENVDIDIFSS